MTSTTFGCAFAKNIPRIPPACVLITSGNYSSEMAQLKAVLSAVLLCSAVALGNDNTNMQIEC